MPFHMQWAYQRRGVLLALALTALGHVWFLLIWQVPVLASELRYVSGTSDSAEVQALVMGRLVSFGDGMGSVAQVPTGVADVSSPQSDHAPAPQVSDGLQIGAFVPSAKLDSPLVPMSAPDTSRLEGLHFSGQAIRLRLLVTDTGRVAEVLTISAVSDDEEAVAHLKAMLLDTAYIPGRLGGRPVAAQVDIELQVDDPL